MSGENLAPVSEMIRSTLVTVGYPETLEKDLEYSGELLTRAVRRLKKKEPKIDFHNEPTHPEELGKQMRSSLIIKAVHELSHKYEDGP